jgi:hypothetical protein
VRDQALNELVDLLVGKSLWFQPPEEDLKSVEDSQAAQQPDSTDMFATKGKVSQKTKNLRMIWYGLFFSKCSILILLIINTFALVIWHSDKPLYQKECCEKIAGIMGRLPTIERKKAWFAQFLFIFNMHWDKVDNFRIDKFLMFLRFQFNQLLRLLQENQNEPGLIEWYQSMMLKLFANSQQGGADTATGIPLQICDIFVAEMSKVDAEASLERLAALLEPFLKALGVLSGGELKDRIIEKVFNPLLENNKTEQVESSDEEEKLQKQEHYHRHVDGGKLPPRTHKQITDMLNRKYVFSGFNILIYAQNYILKFASTSDTSCMKEQNRDQVYKLYEYALELEPKPDRDELTFGQQQLVNRARSFVTMKMKRRQNLRDQKKEGKSLKRLRKLLSDQLMSQQG